MQGKAYFTVAVIKHLMQATQGKGVCFDSQFKDAVIPRGQEVLVVGVLDDCCHSASIYKKHSVSHDPAHLTLIVLYSLRWSLGNGATHTGHVFSLQLIRLASHMVLDLIKMTTEMIKVNI